MVEKPVLSSCTLTGYSEEARLPSYKMSPTHAEKSGPISCCPGNPPPICATRMKNKCILHTNTHQHFCTTQLPGADRNWRHLRAKVFPVFARGLSKTQHPVSQWRTLMRLPLQISFQFREAISSLRITQSHYIPKSGMGLSISPSSWFRSPTSITVLLALPSHSACQAPEKQKLCLPTYFCCPLLWAKNMLFLLWF